MYLCMCVHIYEYIHICMYAYIYIYHIQMYMYKYASIYIYTRRHIEIHKCTHAMYKYIQHGAGPLYMILRDFELGRDR